MSYRIYTAPGSGAMIVEAALELAGLDYEPVIVDWNDLGWSSKVLAGINPLGQIPTLVLPDGTVMTESAAMMLHIGDVAPQSGLVPAPGAPERAQFLHWLVFLVSAIYPTFTFADVPARWVGGDEDSAARLRAGADEHRMMLNRYLETFCGEPWFFGETFTAIDLYFWVMRHWRPGLEWFEKECPRLFGIGARANELPAVARVGGRHFPGEYPVGAA